MREIRVFVSSPGDAQFERRRLERVVERLNGELAGTALLKAIRWETSFYKAHTTFQKQIPEAADCDLVIGILRHRLGTPLPEGFPTLAESHQPYPSGTAYEILSAIEARKTRDLPDIFVFRFAEPPTLKADDPANTVILDQWERLKRFFETWFQNAAGQFKAGFHTFGSTDEFERQLESLLRRWIEERILKGRSVVWPESKGSPFVGLNAFDARHSPVFFGRSRDTARAVDAWKDAAEAGAPFLLLIGPSGAGKSSLARAGLILRLTAAGVVPRVDLWRVAAMLPGEREANPFAALAEALLRRGARGEDGSLPAALPEIAESGFHTPKELSDQLAHADSAAVKPLLAALDRVADAERSAGGYERPVNVAMLLLVDQLEELFAADISDEIRQRFAALLSELVATGRVWVLATLRADLYEQMLTVPKLAALKQAGATYDLAPPGQAELAEIVRGPAAAADLVYETDASGRTLDERLLADADRADMLPLLQFTLDRLFEERVSADGRIQLTHAAYDKVGGIDGAIHTEAERALAGLGDAEVARLPRLLRGLATPARAGEGDGEARGARRLTIRAAPLSSVAHDEPAARLVRALVNARILLSFAGGEGATIRIAHQRVLESWKRAQRVASDNADFYRIRDEVEDERRRWEASGRKRARLIPPGVQLAEAESIAERFKDEVPLETVAFIAASGDRARLRQRLTTAAAIVFLAIGLIAAYFGWQANRNAEAERLAKVEAERNFDAAKEAVDGMTLQLAQGLRAATGMQVATLREILAKIERTVERLSASNPNHFGMQESRAMMLLEFGWTYVAAGDLAAGLAACEEALSIFRKLAEAEPANLSWKRNIAVALEKVGAMRLQMGNTSAAMQAFNEGIEVNRLVLDSAEDPETWKNLALSLAGTGYVDRREGNFAAALKAFEEVLAIFRRLAVDEPDEEKWQGEIASALDRIGDLKFAFGDIGGAGEAYAEGLSLMRVLVEQHSNRSEWRRDLTVALENVGRARLREGDAAGAQEAFEEGLSVARSLAALDTGNMQFQRDLSVALDRVGDLALQQGNITEAMGRFDEALTIRRSLVEDGSGKPRMAATPFRHAPTGLQRTGAGGRPGGGEERVRRGAADRARAGGRRSGERAWKERAGFSSFLSRRFLPTAGKYHRRAR